MEVFEAILSTQVLAGVLIIAAFLMGIRSTLHFTRDASELRPKLNELERELRRLRSGMEERRKTVQALNKEVAPVKESESKMRAYYEELQTLDIEHEREETSKSEQEEADRRRRIQRKKMGMPDG